MKSRRALVAWAVSGEDSDRKLVWDSGEWTELQEGIEAELERPLCKSKKLPRRNEGVRVGALSFVGLFSFLLLRYMPALVGTYHFISCHALCDMTESENGGLLYTDWRPCKTPRRPLMSSTRRAVSKTHAVQPLSFPLDRWQW
ncbi:uncharacterized protein EDB91DRAFT_1081029 [Suillus paluster]|uniref:uncharacterized protein n=1 Tax=Suillus paluster TaxID=48578 RepID=UPI001B881AB6|nr:uncharacterized protein EDB91DRAFT_1081029 [Suillus paluster]KAG1743641.1 hypothetical protein EDB91DRAFT_1081029 [Suillus paluster]